MSSIAVKEIVRGMFVIQKETGRKAKVMSIEDDINEIWLIINYGAYDNAIAMININEFWVVFEEVK